VVVYSSICIASGIGNEESFIVNAGFTTEADSYNLGNCRIGWVYILTIGGTVIDQYHGVLRNTKMITTYHSRHDWEEKSNIFLVQLN